METPSQPANLFKRAQDRIARGALPRQVVHHVWAGKSDGHSCALCDRPIAKGAMEFEVEVDGSPAHWFFDRVCLDVWECECAHQESSVSW